MELSRKQIRLFATFIVIAAVSIIYSNSWENGFHFDDYHTIETNIFIRSLTNADEYFKDAKTFSTIPANASWRPIVTLSVAFDYWMGGGLNPAYFHLSMFVFFILQLGVMYFVFEKIFSKCFEGTTPSWLSFIAVAWYAVHPVSAETVNYFISRSDTLSTFFMLLAFWMYSDNGIFKKYFLYLIPLSIGTMAKPTALMFFPIVVFYEVLFNEKTNIFNPKSYFTKNVLKTAIPVGIFFIAFYALIRHMEAGTFSPGGDSLFQYIITQPFIYARYIEQFFLPINLSADTDLKAFLSVADPKALFGFVFLGLMFYLIFKTQKEDKTRPIAFGLLFFLSALIPTTFVPLAEVNNDHRMFFPFVGLVLSTVTGGYLLFNKYLENKIPNGVIYGFLGLMLCAYGYGTFQRNKVWLSEETLWKDATEKSPSSRNAWLNYGYVFMERGDFKEAEPRFLNALTIAPYNSATHTNLGIIYQKMGDAQKAKYHFETSLDCTNRRPATFAYYGRYLYETGDTEGALKNLYKCLELSPAEMQGRELLLIILFDQEKFDELEKACNEALKVAPDYSLAQQYLSAIKNKKTKLEVLEASAKTKEAFLELSLLYYKNNNFQACIESCKKALALDPNYAKAYNNICSAHNELGQYSQAIEACKKALAINPNFELAKNNLDAALSKTK